MTRPPLRAAVNAKTHDPIYTVHRYFARRPHNVISNIIDYYLQNEHGSIIFDPFGGGGTTLVEGIAKGHRVIASDTSDLAVFVMAEEAAMAQADLNQLEKVFMPIYQKACDRFGQMFHYHDKEVYWIMKTTYTSCPCCGAKVYLCPDTTTGNGNYICKECSSIFKPKNINAEQTEPSGICLMDKGSCTNGKPLHAEIACEDQASLRKYCECVSSQIADSELMRYVIPATRIPDCNLQRESALHKKGILYYEQFVPAASRAVLGYMGSLISEADCMEADKRHMYFILSASMRYCSRFSTINPGWRGRTKPLEWAKSNFWTPYTFVEANPLIGIYDRFNSYKRAVKSAKSRIKCPKPRGSVENVLSGTAQYAILNQSSSAIVGLPDNSVDLIVTDPPYGSYLNYGELSAFWTSWLSKYIPDIKSIPDMEQEAVPARKKGFPGWKSFDDYQDILGSVFKEAYRVLKPGSYCVVTFNNKEPEAWLAFLTAVKQAGFYLRRDGVIFQDGVETYKRTIDSRRAGSIFGDFIYSFQKVEHREEISSFRWESEVKRSLDEIAKQSPVISYNELYASMYLAVLPKLYASIDPKGRAQPPKITTQELESLIESRYKREGDHWILKSN